MAELKKAPTIIFVGAKMNLPYAVVQFPKEGTYSEIPTSWLTNNFTQCRWPITKNPTIFIKKNSPPKADWLLYDIKIECYCETFEKAQKQAEDANYATYEIRECEKRIIHEKQIDNTYTCNENVDDDCDSSLQLCKVPQKKLKTDTSQDSSRKQSFCDKQLYKNQSSCEKISQIAAEKSFSTSNHSLCNKSQTWVVNPLQASNIIDFDESVAVESEIKVQNLDFISTTSPLAIIGKNIEKLIPICMETLKYVKSIDQRLKVLERNINMVENEPKDTFEESHLKLPINSIENLKRFEEGLENAETKANFIEFMKKIGGKDSKNMIHRCMNRLFTNEFGIACSWHGRRNNYRICDLKCMNILKSMLRAKGVDECDFETKASDWFRHSKMRYERENKKSCMSVEEGLSPAPSSSASEADPLYIPSSTVQYTSEQNVEELTENDKASFIWSSKNVYLLLAKYEERMNEFASGAKPHLKIWEHIASDMNKVDPEITVSGAQCHSKMNSMKEIYRKTDLNSISENCKRLWPYFERMYELFGKSEWANPKATTSEVGPSSTANLTNENRNVKEVLVTEKLESKKLLDEFVKQIKQDMQEREKIKEEKKLVVWQELKEQKEKRHKEKIDIMKKFCEAIAGKKLFD